jgi:questin oxidase-like protein
VYYSTASQNESKAVKFDFINIHHTNSAIFFPRFLSHPALNTATKVRLLEWKGRYDLVNYVGRNTPTLREEDITGYKPKHQNDHWPEILKRATLFSDDGHTSKLVRVLALGEKYCKPVESKLDYTLKGDMWEKAGSMAIDSVDNGPNHWIRNNGWQQAWRDVPARQSGKL